MFLDGLNPIVKELGQQPVAFFGGFVSGLLRLNLTDDPVKSWLDKQTGIFSPSTNDGTTPKNDGPQSITIE